MAITKTEYLAPKSADNTTYKSSGSVSTRDFKILRTKVDNQGNTLQTQITQNAEEITLKASKTYVDSSDAALQSQITVNADAITLKASQTSLNTTNTNVSNLTTRVTTAEATLVVQAGQIATKVSTTDLNTTLSNYSTITQTATQIATRVATTDYNGNTIASLINQTSKSISISAINIDINGYVQFSNLTDGVTTINGGNIRTGTISADRIISQNISGWYFGSSDISRSGISLGSGNITLTGTGTNGPTINFNYGGGSTRFYNYAQYWIAAQNNFRVDSQFMSIGTASFLSDINCDGDVGGATGTFGYTITSYVRPSTNDLYDVGTPTYRYDDVYATNGTIQTSDLTEKTDVVPIEHGIDLILNVQPVQFKYINGSSGRVHYGVVAQWLKDTMTNVGIEDAAVYIDPEEGTKGVRYTELIGPMIQTIQHLNERIKVLENGN